MSTTKVKTTRFKQPSDSVQQFLDGAGGIDSKATQIDLKKLTIEELADRAETISKQSHDLLGMICLEARERFQSNIEFGNWRRSVDGLAGYTNQYVTALMNRARFALTHDMTGISLTASFEISAPINQDVAEEVWKYCKRKNMKVEDVRRTISQAKAVVTIDKQELPEHQDPEILERFTRRTELKVIEVIDGVAQEVSEETLEQEIASVELQAGIEVTEEEYEASRMTYDDYAHEIDKFAQTIHMSDLVGIRVYKELILKLQSRMYRK